MFKNGANEFVPFSLLVGWFATSVIVGKRTPPGYQTDKL